jgi:hypothetical protein
VVILYDHVDNGRNLVALESGVTELADAPFECVEFLRTSGVILAATTSPVTAFGSRAP